MVSESPQPSNITLPTIISGHADLVYAVPLLLVSLVLTFVGAFLTLDRTRTFATDHTDHESIYQISKRPTNSKFLSWWIFEGGVGGLCGGWAFATHLVTFLTLFVCNRDNVAPLSTVEFLIVYIISSIICAALAGRFKLVALAMLGLTGGVGFAMILIILLHPSLVTRQVFVAILAPITAIMSPLPIVRTQHGTLRFASAAAGSFGSVLSITLLAHKSSWQDIWERLWLPAAINSDWGTGTEHGFTALACILLFLGIFCDWLLHRKFGENPEEKWDAYLSKYSENIPNASDRAGVFQHSKSWWQKIFHHDSSISKPSTQYAVNPDSMLDSSSLPSKKRSKNTSSKRSQVKFRPLGDYSDSDSESESEFSKRTSTTVPELLSPHPRPWLLDPTSPSLSGPTLYGSDDESDKLGSSKKYHVNLESYSDPETEDIADTRLTSLNRARSHRDEPGWKPGFLNRTAISPMPSSVPPGAVPVTPSLIRAIDRIAAAQSEAYPSVVPPFSTPIISTSTPREVPREHDHKWQSFWKNVHHKSSGV